MTNNEAKQAFIHQIPVCWFNPRRNEHAEGIPIKRISAITWRLKDSGEVIIQLELQSKVGDSVIVADPKDVTII